MSACGLLLLAALATTPVRVGLTRSVAELVVCQPVLATAAGAEPVPLAPAGFTVRDAELLSDGRLWPPGTSLTGFDGAPVEIELRAAVGRPTRPRRYRGAIRLQPLRDRLLVVNDLPLEDYLRGVVPLELNGPPEALRAQAVAARSYALARRSGRGLVDFEVAVTQAYGGVEAELPAADAAVAATAGQVLLVAGRPLEAVYSACCGGVTASAEEAWNATIDGLLVGLDLTPRAPATLDEEALRQHLAAPCGWCQANRLHRWTERFGLAELDERLRARLPSLVPRAAIGALRELRVTRRGPSARAVEVTITGEAGSAVVRTDAHVRRLLGRGSQWLPSSLFVLDREGDGYRLLGGGHGHGAGLCQAGALAQAAVGRRAEELLSHYYPGATLERWEPGR